MKKKLVLFDGDGVLYIENEPLPQAIELLNELKKRGINYYLITNNSTKSIIQYKDKLKTMGFNFSSEEILTSAYTTLSFLKTKYPYVSTVFVIGGDGINDACKKYNLNVIDVDEATESVDVVIIGMDHNFTYKKLELGMKYILNGSMFIATNPDVTFPTSYGLKPGAGALIAALSSCVGKNPDYIIGKPSKYLYEEALRKSGNQRDDVIMIGDRFETDILGAINSNIDTLMIRTGLGGTYSHNQIIEQKQKAGKKLLGVIDNLIQVLSYI
jgi:4-nitrophenyl phosphatase